MSKAEVIAQDKLNRELRTALAADQAERTRQNTERDRDAKDARKGRPNWSDARNAERA